MINTLVKKIVGSKNERDVKRMQPSVARINALEQEFAALSDEELRGKTAAFLKSVKWIFLLLVFPLPILLLAAGLTSGNTVNQPQRGPCRPVDPAAPARHAALRHAPRKPITRSNRKQELPTTGQTPKPHGILRRVRGKESPL